ncbi:XrtA-associated tyrosine autokinase [Leptothrix discophora]|uniref:non-specific protein-tyrosine kinase n=1 Tax=Leptothrix discophora TaxID=89 RepID=A0ABT9G4Y6_LEPDI|nr:XrtA-associated tyrosine autokinase [Leptothrix discophora]MDP4301337.1 XrtA-associated tyrosine autokinase [Leptothrix discophora]
MSLIEQAAKRLEELRRAGIEVPNLPMPPAPSPAHARPAVMPLGADVRAAVAAATALPPAPDEPQRRSREVRIDVSRLEREGYLVPSQARSQLAEQMRIIKRPLLANARGDSGQQIARPNLIQVASALPEEGKTFFAINLAMSIAMEVDHHVLLVDADVLRPSVLGRLGVEPAAGLMDVLKNKDMKLSDVLLRTNIDKLSLLPAGTANKNSTELLASTAMHELLDELASKYADRIIVFDAPPLLPTTESRVLATHMGQVVMVVEAEKTTHAQVTQAYAALAECPVVLSVLNKCHSRGTSNAYGYYYAS